MTKLSVATSKRYKDSNGEWQEKTQWHSCVCYGVTADYAAKIHTGAHVFIEGASWPIANTNAPSKLTMGQ
jgi:single-strand DNA-binding protein